jgi:hypothetical protein
MKVIMNKYCFCLILFSCIGCGAKKGKLSSILTTPNCYWDVHDAYSASNRKIGYCYKFNKDGKCLYLLTPNKYGKRVEYYDDDIIVPKEWKLNGDSVIFIRSIERRVLSFSPDTLLLQNPTTHEKDTLINNCK